MALLRAIEWKDWPLFLSQPVVPVLLYFYPWPWIVGLVVIATFAWWFMVAPETTPSPNIDLAVYFVYLRFLASPLMAVLIWQSGRPWIAVLALLWPFVGILLVGYVLMFPEAMLDWTARAKAAQIGVIQKRLMSRLGYVRRVPPDAGADRGTVPPPPTAPQPRAAHAAMEPKAAEAGETLKFSDIDISSESDEGISDEKLRGQAEAYRAWQREQGASIGMSINAPSPSETNRAHEGAVSPVFVVDEDGNTIVHRTRPSEIPPGTVVVEWDNDDNAIVDGEIIATDVVDDELLAAVKRAIARRQRQDSTCHADPEADADADVIGAIMGGSGFAAAVPPPLPSPAQPERTIPSPSAPPSSKANPAPRLRQWEVWLLVSFAAIAVVGLVVGLHIGAATSPFRPAANVSMQHRRADPRPRHMQAALDYVRSAGDVVEAAKAGDKYPDKSFSDKSFSEFVEYHPKLLEYSEEALVEAKQTNRQEMNNWYPGLGDHFKNELEEGLKLSASGITTKEKWTFIRGLGLQIRFGDWYNTHHNAIWGTKNTSPPPQLEDDPPAAAPKARPPGQTMGTDSLPSPGCVLGLPCSCGGGPNTPWVCRPDYTAATKSAITTPPPKPARHGRGPVRLNQPPRSCWDPYYRRYYAC